MKTVLRHRIHERETTIYGRNGHQVFPTKRLSSPSQSQAQGRLRKIHYQSPRPHGNHRGPRVPLESTPKELDQELRLRGFEVATIKRIKFPCIKELTPLVKIILTNPKQTTQAIQDGIAPWFKNFQVEEPNNSSRHVLQCFNCQRFCHTRSVCTTKAHCVCCSGEHQATDCQKSRQATTCSNCKGQHVACHRGCLEFQLIAGHRSKTLCPTITFLPPSSQQHPALPRRPQLDTNR
ncbi:uncharacterized protein LOC106467239 [Limulus polyphemus]|uniref:Uncharacterized protein LOC106467239 n=1 Tax=Limulus polyphemus TaxID=6850 RepID=A0ABM1BJ46_LIMPO|nr:uncharacterized protein LOC106467239 [Limulus polyphemus]